MPLSQDFLPRNGSKDKASTFNRNIQIYKGFFFVSVYAGANITQTFGHYMSEISLHV